ncbi:hypothetical protein V6768_04600 [Tistrella mobilis]
MLKSTLLPLQRLHDPSPEFEAELNDASAALTCRLAWFDEADPEEDDDAALEALIDDLLLLYERLLMRSHHARDAAGRETEEMSPMEHLVVPGAACRTTGMFRPVAPTVFKVDLQAGCLLVPAGDRDALDAWLAAMPE